ncbi:MAG: hypothetical protein ACXAC7_13905 [Candidatus Hodarchaeales archaeon]
MSTTTDKYEILPILMLVSWSESRGPELKKIYPPETEISQLIPSFNALGFSAQIFMVASSLFGPGAYQREVVDLPVILPEDKFRVRVFFDYREVPEDEVRGGRLPYMLIIAHSSDKSNRSGLTKLEPELELFLSDYCKNQIVEANLHSLWKNIRFGNLLEFTTIDEFFKILQRFSEALCFGMVNSTIIRSNVISEIDLSKYLPRLPIEDYKPNELGQIFINELEEYFYCFWIGPFSFLFRSPLKYQEEFIHFMKEGLPQILESLWSLTLNDPTSETSNLVNRIELNPRLAGDLLSLAEGVSVKKLAGIPFKLDSNVSVLPLLDSRIPNPDVLYYLHGVAENCARVKKSEIPSLLAQVHKRIGSTHLNGVLTAIGYYYGDLILTKKNRSRLSLPSIIRNVYTGLSSWRMIDANSVLIKNVNKDNYYFLKGILSVIFLPESIDIKFSEENELVVQIKDLNVIND